MELHGGAIGAHSDGLGKGTCFFLELPLIRSMEFSNHSTDLETNSLQECSFCDMKYSSVRRLPVMIPFAHPAFQSRQSSMSSMKSPQLRHLSPQAWLNRSNVVVPVSDDEKDQDLSVESVTAAPLSRTQFASQKSRSVASDGSQSVQDVLVLRQSSNSGHMHVSDSEEETRRTWESGLRVLLVDDSVPNRKVLKKLLISHGHSVSEAVDGVDFLRCLGFHFAAQSATRLLDTSPNGSSVSGKVSRAASCSNISYDVVLIDENMPRLNGSFAVELARQEGYSGLIVGITGNADTASIQSFKERGADDVIGKPIHLARLKKTIVDLMRRRTRVSKQHVC